MPVDLQKRALFRRVTLQQVPTDIHLPWLKSTGNFLDNCTRCGACQDACPEHIIVQGDGGYPTVDFNAGACTFCGKCADSCPENLFEPDRPVAWTLNLAISDECFAERGIVCQSCRDACDAKAIRFHHSRGAIPRPIVDVEQCTSCGACVSACPADAIALKKEEIPNE